MINKPITITPKLIWSAISVTAILITATAGVTWEVRKDVIESLKLQIEAYEKSNSWNLPGTIAEMKKASEALTLRLSERKELDELRSQSSKDRAELTKLHQSLKESETKLLAAQATLEKIILKTESVDLTEGQSAALVENNLYLGVRILTSTSVHVVLANDNSVLNIGEAKAYNFGGKSCQVRLLRVADGSSRRATFNYGCA